MPQNASECTSEHLKLPKKIPGGAYPQIPLQWTTAGRPFSLLQIMALSPQMEKVMYGPGVVVLTDHLKDVMLRQWILVKMAEHAKIVYKLYTQIAACTWKGDITVYMYLSSWECLTKGESTSLHYNADKTGWWSVALQSRWFLNVRYNRQNTE